MTGDTLDEIGRRRGSPQSSDGLDFLTAYEECLAGAGEPEVLVLLPRDDGLATANAFAERYPGATVHLVQRGSTPARAPDPDTLPNVRVHVCGSNAERQALLAALPRPDLLVEGFRDDTGPKLTAMRQLHGYVRAGGTYAVEHIDRGPEDVTDAPAGPSVRAVVEEADARSGAPPPPRGWASWVDSVAQSLESVSYVRDLALLRKRETLPRMLRASEAEEVLAARYGDTSPLTVLEVRPGFTFESRARLSSYGEGPAVRSGSITVPPRAVRSYRDVVTYPRQLVRHDTFWLPDSFRHQQAPRLRHHGLIRSGDELALVRPRWRPEKRRRVDGPVYYLDTEFPGHFGHVCTEVVSRLWGWDHARRAEPGIRLLVTLRPGQSTLPAFERDILTAYGVDLASVVVQSGDELLEVERLVAADPEFENPHYVDPAISDTWERIRSGLPPVEPPVAGDRVFVSRSGRRACLQGPKVERFFRRRGFTIVLPEEHSYAEQVAIFARARIIAGYGGSGIFTMMHAPQARVIIISGDAYVAQNEALIAAVNGNEVHHFWGRTRRLPPDPKRRRTVFADDFTFDLRRHARALRKLTK